MTTAIILSAIVGIPLAGLVIMTVIAHKEESK